MLTNLLVPIFPPRTGKGLSTGTRGNAAGGPGKTSTEWVPYTLKRIHPRTPTRTPTHASPSLHPHASHALGWAWSRWLAADGQVGTHLTTDLVSVRFAFGAVGRHASSSARTPARTQLGPRSKARVFTPPLQLAPGVLPGQRLEQQVRDQSDRQHRLTRRRSSSSSRCHRHASSLAQLGPRIKATDFPPYSPPHKSSGNRGETACKMPAKAKKDKKR